MGSTNFASAGCALTARALLILVDYSEMQPEGNGHLFERETPGEECLRPEKNESNRRTVKIHLKDQVVLQLFSDLVRARPDFLETRVKVKSARPKIMLPDSQPHRISAAFPRSLNAGLQQ